MAKSLIVAVCLGGLFVAGCSMEAGGSDVGVDPADVKPADASELSGANLGSAEQAHALHYTDGTNQWSEKTYPMGTDNPNCKDWWIYDRYLSSRPVIGTTKFTTWETNHPWATGAYIDSMMALLPDSLGYSGFWKTLLVDHNSVVARTSGKCSGRYVFQWDNRTNFGPFESTQYWVSVNVPGYLIAPNKAACTSTAGESVPAALIDLYVCEAPNSASVTSISSWCSNTSGHWRKVGSSSTNGYWTASLSSCSAATGVFYPTPVGKVAVSFNAVVKTGIGHGPAPAEIYVIRYN